MFGIDDILLGTLIGGVGSGLISTAGQIYTNNKNLEYQKNVNDINWQIAAQNNATQIDMANTAHQREIRDLQSAGLNPILSAGGNGAATPSLTSARMDSAQIENPTNGIANSAKSLGKFVSGMAKAELDQARADVRLTDQESKRLERENVVSSLRSKNELMKLEAENAALSELTRSSYRDDRGVWHNDFDRDLPYNKLVKESLVSDVKDRSNRNWRNNLGVINQSVNSASSILPWNIKRKLKGR